MWWEESAQCPLGWAELVKESLTDTWKVGRE